MPLADLSDRLSPIIVKELRQGVRGHLFTGAFLLQEILLLSVATISLLPDASPGNREAYTIFFWAFVTIPLVIILPLGAAVSISGELAANTLEPLLLTRLTAWRLVAGKWAATASQAIVLAIAALPFVLVRYYLGAVEMVGDLTFLGAYVGCSLLLASVAVAISPARLSALFRWVLMVVVAFVLAISFLVAMGTAVYARLLAAHGALDPTMSMLALLGVVLLTVLAALEAAALQIAPAALAWPLRLRLLALAALGAAAWVGLQARDDLRGMAIVWALALVAVTTVAALCEQAPLLRSRYAGFYRRRLLVPLAWFLAPGWPGGVGFLLLVASVTAMATASFHGPTTAVFVLGGILGSLLLPLVIGRTFFPRAPSFLLLLLVTVLSAAFSTIAPVALNIDSQALWSVGCVLLPLCPAAYAMARLGWYGDYGDSPATVLPAWTDAVFAAFVVLVVVAALWHTVRAWRQIGRLVRQPPA